MHLHKNGPRRHGLPSRLGTALLCLFLLGVGSARGQDEEGTQDEDLAPGIKLRIGGCGYDDPNSGRVQPSDDDDATDDDDAADDDDSAAGDDDDSAGDDDDSGAR